MFPRLTLKHVSSKKDFETGLGTSPDCTGDDCGQAGLQSPTSTVVSSTNTDLKSVVMTEKVKQRAEKLDRAAEKKNAEKEVMRTVTMLLESYPQGYPSQAAFQSSDSSFSIYRSFDYLHSRVILELQDELRCLESDLTELDEEHGFGTTKAERYRVRSREMDIKAADSEDGSTSRSTLLSIIRDKLVQYDEVLLKARELNTFQRPSDRDYKSLRYWCLAKKPLIDEEQAFVLRKEDLVSLRQGREWAGFDGWIESSIKRLPEYIKQSLFTTPELREKTKDTSIEFYSPSRVEKLVGLIITLIIFILLILPVIAMYKLTSFANRNSTIDAVGLLVVFTLLFSAAMSLLTKAKRHELFAASAAYCAVLVVFISNFSNNSSTGSGAIGT